MLSYTIEPTDTLQTCITEEKRWIVR